MCVCVCPLVCLCVSLTEYWPFPKQFDSIKEDLSCVRLLDQAGDVVANAIATVAVAYAAMSKRPDA